MEKIHWPSVENLNNLNFTPYLEKIPNDLDFKKYYDKVAGMEHYRLLTWISNYFNNCELVEIGVFNGFSGLALSNNPTNKVTGFDIASNFCVEKPSNYNYIIDNYQNHTNTLLNAKLIFFDTVHDGASEFEFIEHIKAINYSGIIIFDDILLNEEMREFWKQMSKNYMSQDITNIGHCTGTGVIWV